MKKTRSYLYVIAAAALWGCLGLFFRLLSGVGFSQMQVVAIRVTVAAAVLAVVMAIKDRKLFRFRLKDVWCFIGTGIVSLVFFNWCYFTAMDLTGLSVAAVLLYTAPIFVMALSVWLFKERFGKWKLVALIVTFLGCVLVTGLIEGSGRVSAAGIFAGLGAGVGYALYSIFGRYALMRGYHSMTISFYTFLFAAAAAVPLSGIWNVPAQFWNTDTLLGALGIGVLCCLIPYWLYTMGLEGIENSRASIIATIEPVVAAVLSVTVFGEQLSVWKIIGMLCIFSSVVFLNIRTKKE